MKRLTKGWASSLAGVPAMYLASVLSMPGLSHAQAQTSAPVAPLSPLESADGSSLHPAWRFADLGPKHPKPPTRFELTRTDAGDATPALRISTDKSYGLLVHANHGSLSAGQTLAWRWRLDTPLDKADITRKDGDDSALKVCVMFDQPAADIPLFQRAGLALARSAAGMDVPNATLCYLWDNRYASGTSGSNAFTARVRYIVLQGPSAPLGQWVRQQRRVADDFLHLFGKESPVVPPVLAVAVGADSDNTQGHSVGYVSQLRWAP